MASVDPAASGEERLAAEQASKFAARMRNLRANPMAVVLLFAGVVGVLYVTGSIIAQSFLPSDGVLLTEFMTTGLRVATRLDSETDLRIGDEIIAIENQSIWDLGERTWRGEGAPDWQVGQVLTYQVRRDGQLIDVPVMLKAFSPGRLFFARFGAYALIFAGLAMGGYVAVNRPEEIAAHLFFMLATCVMLTLGLHFQATALVTPWLLVAEGIVKFAARVMLFSTFLHLCLIFPVPKLRLAPGSVYLRLVHVVNPAIAVVTGLLFGATPLHRFVLASQVATWIGLLMLLASVASIAHTYVTVRQPMVRGQIRWIAWGTLVGIVPYILFTGLPELVMGRALLTVEMTAFFLIAVPLALAIAIARYRLFDIDTFVWQMLFYVLYVVFIVGLYLVLKRVSGWVLMTLAGKSNEAYVVFIATCIAASAFWVLRKPVIFYADRLLYRSQRRPQVLLGQAIEKLTRAIHLEQLMLLLAEELPEQLGASHGELLVMSEDGSRLELLGDGAFDVPSREVVGMWMEHGAVPILRSTALAWVPPEALALMERRDIELAVPLRVGDRIVGLWGLGPRVGQLSYPTSDVRLVETIARQAALAVENARLVREMQSDQQQLGAEVQRRTQVMQSDRNRLNAILQNMADALMVTDATERIQLTNPAFERLVRQSSRSLLGRSLADVVPIPELSEVIQQSLAVPGTIYKAEVTLANPRLSASEDVVMGETILEISVTALGDKSSVICVLRDITRDVEVDHMKSEFISTISHELRTPVTAILGFAKLTERAFHRSIFPLLPQNGTIRDTVERLNKNLSIMVSEGETLTTLINDILDISALDAGTIAWNDQPYALVLLIQDVVERLSEEAEAKGLSIETHLEEGLPMLIVDPARIEHALANLITNGIKFTQSGRLMITARRLAGGTVIHDWDVPARGGVVVAVQDTGPGMRPQELSNIFQRFYQVASTVSGKPSGTGLGLAISREIVTHYGGDIWAESTLGVGSTFYFTLPLAREH